MTSHLLYICLIIFHLLVLKIITVTPDEVHESLNLRAGSNLTLNSSSNDVKWGNNGKNMEYR